MNEFTEKKLLYLKIYKGHSLFDLQRTLRFRWRLNLQRTLRFFLHAEVRLNPLGNRPVELLRTADPGQGKRKGGALS